VNTLILPLCVWLAAGLSCACAAPATITANSFSGQFVARELEPETPEPALKGVRTPIAGGWAFVLTPRPLAEATNTDEITLQPAVLVVSCERLKALFLAQLGLADHWRGWVDLRINPALAPERGPQLTAVQDPGGWNYEMELPKRVPADILQEALVQTLLLELVNRNATNRCAEIPTWLIDGFSAHLKAFNLPTFMLQPGVQQVGTMRLEGSTPARDLLRRQSPLSFQQLCWPQPGDMSGDGLALYRVCSQLFFEGLLQFPDGRACLNRMLAILPEHLNWQTSFLLAFHPHFDQLLDVEKWWALTSVTVSRTDPAPSWNAEQSRKMIQSALDVPVSVHLGAAQLPVDARYTLQEAIAQWPSLDSTVAVERAIAALQPLPARSAREWSLVATLYLKTLENYLNGVRQAARPQPLGKNTPSTLGHLKADTIKQLDMLDQQRVALQAQFPPRAPRLGAAQNPAPVPGR
jgi:hypothetical protein